VAPLGPSQKTEQGKEKLSHLEDSVPYDATKQASKKKKIAREAYIFVMPAEFVALSLVSTKSSVEKVVDHLVIGVEYGNDAIISFKIMISPPQSLNACRNVICCKPTWNCEILLFLLVAADTFLVFFIG
jgi:hypothetical protein